MWSINARREREGDLSSSQCLSAAAACLVACLSFTLSSQRKFKPKLANNTSWTCERELRLWMKVGQLLGGRKGGWNKWEETDRKKKEKEKENRERKKKRKNKRKMEEKYYQTVQTYLELKGMGHVVSFCPLVLQTQNWKWWRIPKKNWPKPPRLIVKETENN
jgi:hypothetical protein